MIEANELTKRYGGRTAVDRLSFSVRPGQVTGFLGPNGAGKTTTLRLILGLDAPTGGTATVSGVPFRSHPRGLRHVCALIDAGQVHGGRTAAAHLSALAHSNGISPRRVDEVLYEVGLADAAPRCIGGFSLGMKQRLGIAGALLGDPPVLMSDEPVNGMDPEGVLWMRRLSTEGRFAARSASFSVVVATPQAAELAAVLIAAGASVEPEGSPGAEKLTVTGLPADRIGALAFENRMQINELTTQTASLEEAFMELTTDRVEYQAGQPR
ncbi:ATP-binding cassette domain-containing protein [Streptomyces niveus]|uniref:ATP-binding cassette domain-containing protein n=1 Tax=Streptomyces niveus TaxID=193462 RepID=UPI00366986C4